MLHMEQAPELILSSKTADLKSGIKTDIYMQQFHIHIYSV